MGVKADSDIMSFSSLGISDEITAKVTPKKKVIAGSYPRRFTGRLSYTFTPNEKFYDEDSSISGSIKSHKPIRKTRELSSKLLSNTKSDLMDTKRSYKENKLKAELWDLRFTKSQMKSQIESSIRQSKQGRGYNTSKNLLNSAKQTQAGLIGVNARIGEVEQSLISEGFSIDIFKEMNDDSLTARSYGLREQEDRIKEYEDRIEDLTQREKHLTKAERQEFLNLTSDQTQGSQRRSILSKNRGGSSRVMKERTVREIKDNQDAFKDLGL